MDGRTRTLAALLRVTVTNQTPIPLFWFIEQCYSCLYRVRGLGSCSISVLGCSCRVNHPWIWSFSLFGASVELRTPPVNHGRDRQGPSPPSYQEQMLIQERREQGRASQGPLPTSSGGTDPYLGCSISFDSTMTLDQSTSLRGACTPILRTSAPCPLGQPIWGGYI